jgi:hypothetical protein
VTLFINNTEVLDNDGLYRWSEAQGDIRIHPNSKWEGVGEYRATCDREVEHVRRRIL